MNYSEEIARIRQAGTDPANMARTRLLEIADELLEEREQMKQKIALIEQDAAALAVYGNGKTGRDLLMFIDYVRRICENPATAKERAHDLHAAATDILSSPATSNKPKRYVDRFEQTILTLADQPGASAIILVAARAILHGQEPQRIAAMTLETYEKHLSVITPMAEEALRLSPAPPTILQDENDTWRKRYEEQIATHNRLAALETFTEEVRRQTGRMIVQSQTNPQRAQEMAAELCTQAANLLNQEQMQEEVKAGDYDLATLPQPDMNPFEEE